jgi:hypothetical protein
MSQESVRLWIPTSTNKHVDSGKALLRTIAAALCLLSVCVLKTFSQTASSLANDIAWSTAHEGCDLYRGNSLRPLSELRTCFAKTQHDSPHTVEKIRACPSNVLTRAIRLAIELSLTKYEIEQNFTWVAVHEGQLQSFHALAAEGKFREIRKRYRAIQDHNPDARNNLSVLSDNQIDAMLTGTSLSVIIENDAALSRLNELAELVPSKKTIVPIQIKFSEFVKTIYGSVFPNLMSLIEQKNPGVAGRAAPNQKVGEIVLHFGDEVVLPSLPRIDRPTTIRIPPDKYAEAIHFIAAEANGISAEIDVSGEIEEPVHVSAQPTAAKSVQPTDDGWYLDKLGLKTLSRTDLSLVADSVVGVVDGGADLKSQVLSNHFWRVPPDLSDEQWLANDAGYDCYHQRPDPVDEMDNSHGTHISGLITGIRSIQRLPEMRAALGDKIKLAELKITGYKPRFSMTIAENCILESYEKTLELYNISFRSEYSFALQRYISEPSRIGKSLFVVAAGNDTTSLDDDLKKHQLFRDKDHHPLKNVIFVTALGRSWETARFSNYGPKSVQIAAPGVDISSTVRNGRLKTLSGTSQAAPFVTMTAAIIHSEMPHLDWQQIKQRILDTCDWMPDLEDYVINGCRLNILKAIIRNRDLVELRDNAILKGTVSKEDITFPQSLVAGTPEWKNQLVRIWVKDSGKSIYLTTVNRTEVDMNPDDAVRIDTKDPYECPTGTSMSGDQHKCRIPLSRVRDVVFRIQ